MTKIRRIAIFTRTYPPKGGGIAAAHYALAQCLKEQHEIAVFAFDDDEEDREANVYRAKTPQWLAKIMKWLARMWVRHYAKKESSTNCQRIFSVAPAVWKLNKSIRAFNPDFILCPDNFVPALALKKPMNSELVWIAHNNFRRFEGNPIATNYSWIDLQLAHRLELRGFAKANALVAVSQYMLKVAKNTLSPACPTEVINNYFDGDFMSTVQPSSLRDDLGLGPDVMLVYIPSGGASMKGERYVFEIIRRLSRKGAVAFFISGNVHPHLKFELDNAVEELIVYCPGEQSYSKNLSDVAGCDISISPTLIENFSSAILEALALGVPVVSFDVGGNKELIKNGKNGWIVPYLDIDSLIERSVHLLLNKEELAAMKVEARDSVFSFSDPERVLSKYNSLFSKLAKNT